MTGASTTPCRARPNDDLMICEACGFEWSTATAKPTCDPIRFETLRARMMSETIAAENSLLSVCSLDSKGMPTDGGAAARRRYAEINAVLRLVERCAGSKAIRDLLNGKPKP